MYTVVILVMSLPQTRRIYKISHKYMSDKQYLFCFWCETLFCIFKSFTKKSYVTLVYLISGFLIGGGKSPIAAIEEW